MLKKYLEQIGKIEINLVLTKKIGNTILNSAIFGEEIPKNLLEYKKVFIEKLEEKKETLEKIEKIILEKNNNLKNLEIKILKKEIFVKFKKIEFLKKVYDVEANKLDKNYKIEEEIEDYDYYNEIFYGVTKKNLEKEIIISENKKYNIFVSKEKLIELLEFSKEKIPELKWQFGDFIGLSHENGILNIPNEKQYDIKRIIAIFFHEMTHFFRYLNGKKNLGFDFIFSDYDSLEEGITGYNEYFYGNKIIDYGEYNYFYDKCYQIVLENISEEEKKDKIYGVLKNKGFDKSKINNYYKRFYRYTRIGGKKLFLKDLIYSNAYNNVINLLECDKKNYEKIMVGKIGLFELENNFLNSKNNFDSKKYFDIMVEKIKDII